MRTKSFPIIGELFEHPFESSKPIFPCSNAPHKSVLHSNEDWNGFKCSWYGQTIQDTTVRIARSQPCAGLTRLFIENNSFYPRNRLQKRSLLCSHWTRPNPRAASAGREGTRHSRNTFYYYCNWVVSSHHHVPQPFHYLLRPSTPTLLPACNRWAAIHSSPTRIPPLPDRLYDRQQAEALQL